LNDLDTLEWPERVKAMQRNWIGRSEGVEFDLAFATIPTKAIRVFTTRPDTGFGITYAVVAPEHPLARGAHDERTAGQRHRARRARRRRAKSCAPPPPRAAPALEKRGAFTGSYVINPFNGESVPVYVADYVLGTYGTGAIMAVPGEDERDHAFALAYGLPVVHTTQAPDGFDGGAYTGDGVQDQLRLPGRSRRRQAKLPRSGVPRGARAARSRSTIACATG
jgi:leucyl-tRNA synthetase